MHIHGVEYSGALRRDALLVFGAQLAGLEVCWLGGRHGLVVAIGKASVLDLLFFQVHVRIESWDRC